MFRKGERVNILLNEDILDFFVYVRLSIGIRDKGSPERKPRFDCSVV